MRVLRFAAIVLALGLLIAAGVATSADPKFDITQICPNCEMSGDSPMVCETKVSKSGAMIGATSNGKQCIESTYGRGVGTVPDCSNSQEKQGALCYPKCRAGYKRLVGVCWQKCPAAFRDDGAFCFKPGNYQRDKYIWEIGDRVGSLDGARARCAKKHPVAGCEKQGQIIYEKCKSGWVEIGLDWCGPSCPDKMKDIGISCAKDKIDQSTEGTPPSVCETGQELYVPPGQLGATKTGLCYDACFPGWKGAGPICQHEG